MGVCACSGFYFENYEAEGDGPESLQVFLNGCRLDINVFTLLLPLFGCFKVSRTSTVPDAKLNL